MTEKSLFEGMPEQAGPQRPVGKPRLLEPMRDQIELRSMDIDSLIGEDHAARLIWAYVEQLDLRELEDAIKAREGTPGHPAITPRLLLALWLYATSEGVGSARALERLCESHDAYRWLVGGVSVNYHTLSDFRVGHGALLDRLLTENVAMLAQCGLVDLDQLTQDGVRIRASAGATSYRRRATLEHHLACAREVVEHLKREVDDDPAASNRRIHKARERAARERAARVAAALETLGEVEAQRARREKTHRKQTEKQKEPRASTTDPEVRPIKMADGGFRPAWNVQVVTAAGEQIVVGVAPSAVGSDRGLLRPMLETIRKRFGRLPAAISPTADSWQPTTSNGLTAKASRSIVHRPNPSMAVTRSSREPPMVPACSPGEAGWQATRGRRSTSIARSASASRPSAQLEPAASECARRSQGHGGAALARARQQHPASRPHAQSPHDEV